MLWRWKARSAISGLCYTGQIFDRGSKNICMRASRTVLGSVDNVGDDDCRMAGRNKTRLECLVATSGKKRRPLSACRYAGGRRSDWRGAEKYIHLFVDQQHIVVSSSTCTSTKLQSYNKNLSTLQLLPNIYWICTTAKLTPKTVLDFSRRRLQDTIPLKARTHI